MNVVAISGNVGADPEIRYFESGKSKAQFTLAVRGFSKDETHWIDCEAWGKTAQLIADYVRKGSKVSVSGSLKQEKWEKDGQKRSKLIVNVERIDLPPKTEGAAAPAADSWDDEPF